MVSEAAPPPIVHYLAGRGHVRVIVQVQGAGEVVWLLGRSGDFAASSGLDEVPEW